MHIESIKISNFRKISPNTVINFDKQTIIVGKNNTGKTSISEIITKCLTSKGQFKIEDFSSGILNRKILNEVYEKYEYELKNNNRKPITKEKVVSLQKGIPSIILEAVILIEDNDNLAEIKNLLYEFEKNDKIIIRMKLEFLDLQNCVLDYKTYISSINEKNQTRNENKKVDLIDFYDYIKRNFSNYFKLNAYSSKPDSEYEMPISIEYVRSLFNIGIIAAQREIDDTSDQSLQTISGAIWNYYQKITKGSIQLDNEDEYKFSINEIQENLNQNYDLIFENLIAQVNENILITDSSIKVNIESDYNIEEILKKNSKLKYNIDELVVPESYNGLGYNNLMYIFIQIITYKHKVEIENKVFNLLFIEEPESHLHPQMQATFLNKVQDILECSLHTNTIITTHSSYILQNSDLDSIRYFMLEDNYAKVKSLKCFFKKPEYKNLKPFLKRYFKINTCDLFFADKAILIEGSSERILMPIFKSILDKTDNSKEKKITKQHITTLEVGGAYAHKFYELLSFLEIKTLIITDIDSVSGKYNSACKCDLRNESSNKNEYEIKTSNNVIKNWFGATGEKLYIKTLIDEYVLSTKQGREKFLAKKLNDCSLARITFQTPIEGELYWGRTFEEQLLKENSQYLTDIIVGQAKQNIEKEEKEIANHICSLEEAIRKSKIVDSMDQLTSDILINNIFDIVSKLNKVDFAFDLLMLEEWEVPQYIREGLEWLRE